MNRLPPVVCTTIVRTAHKSENHGGIFLVDLETGRYSQIVDWTDESIDWAGRGGDRGLRGMATYKGELWVAASRALHVFNQDFEVVRSYTNSFLKGIHEIYRDENKLLITSTAYDCIVEFDMDAEEFGDVHWLSRRGEDDDDAYIQYQILSSNSKLLDEMDDTLHINNISIHGDYMLAGASRVGALLVLNKGQIFPFGKIPVVTHNAQPFQGGVVYTLAEKGSLNIDEISGKSRYAFDLIRYPEQNLLHGNLKREFAHQGFARGLCMLDEDILVTGSSPATLSVYSLSQNKCLKTINMTMDVRQATHSIVPWPP